MATSSASLRRADDDIPAPAAVAAPQQGYSARCSSGTTLEYASPLLVVRLWRVCNGVTGLRPFVVSAPSDRGYCRVRLLLPAADFGATILILVLEPYVPYR